MARGHRCLPYVPNVVHKQPETISRQVVAVAQLPREWV